MIVKNYLKLLATLILVFITLEVFISKASAVTSKSTNSRVSSSAANSQLNTRLQKLEIRMASLEKQLRQIKTQTSNNSQLNQISEQLDSISQVLQISGSNVTLRSNGKLTLQSSSKTEIKSGTSLTLEGQTSALLKSTSTNIEASGTVKVNGAIVKFNNGNKPVARLGSKTIGSPVTQSIIDGSSKILVP